MVLFDLTHEPIFGKLKCKFRSLTYTWRFCLGTTMSFISFRPHYFFHWNLEVPRLSARRSAGDLSVLGRVLADPSKPVAIDRLGSSPPHFTKGQ